LRNSLRNQWVSQCVCYWLFSWDCDLL